MKKLLLKQTIDQQTINYLISSGLWQTNFIYQNNLYFLILDLFISAQTLSNLTIFFCEQTSQNYHLHDLLLFQQATTSRIIQMSSYQLSIQLQHSCIQHLSNSTNPSYLQILNNPNLFIVSVNYEEQKQLLNIRCVHFNMIKLYIYYSELVRWQFIQLKMIVNTGKPTIDQLAEQLKHLSNIENAKFLQQLVQSSYRDMTFIQLLLSIIENIHLFKIEGDIRPFLKNCAIVLNQSLKRQFQDDNFVAPFQENLRYFINLLLNWNLPFQIKKLLINSFSAFLTKWQNELDEFFEKLMQILIKLMDVNVTKLKNEKHLSKVIYCKNIQSEFHINAILPQHTAQIYHTIIFIAEGIFSQFQTKPGAYQEKIIQIFKNVHQQIFNHQYIERFLGIFTHIFIFWQNFNFDGLDLKNKLKPAYICISNWDTFSSDIQTIMNYKAVPYELSQNTYNFFLLTQNIEEFTIMQLKLAALQTYNQILSIEQNILQSTFNNSPICQSIMQISNSIIYSLKFSVEQQIFNSSQNKQLQIAMINTFSIYANEFRLDLRSYSQILNSIIFPLITQQVKQLQDQLDTIDGVHVLLQTLNDCCDGQIINEVLPAVSKCLETIVEGNQNVIEFIKNFIFYSLSKKCKLNQTIKLNFKAKPLQLAPSLLILNILSYSNVMKDQQLILMRLFFTQQIFYSLTNYQKIYCYNYLCVNWTDIYKSQQHSGSFFFNYCCSNSCSREVQIFGLDFIANNCQWFFQEQYILNLIQEVSNVDKQQELNIIFQIFTKNIRYHLQRFSQQTIIFLIQKLTTNTIQAVQIIQVRSTKYNKYLPVARLNLCRQISKDHQFIQGKPAVVRSLFKVLDHIKKYSQVLIDDEAVWIGGELIQATGQIPQNFNNLLQNIGQTFRNSQYNGMSYFYFLGSSIQVLNNYDINQQILNLINQLYEILIEGFSYFTQYPQQLINQHYQGIAAHQMLLQNIFFLFGDKLDQKFIQQTKQLCHILLKRIAGLSQYILVTRTHNLILLCQILTTKKYGIKKISNFAENSYYLSNYDATLLIFLLNKIRPEFPDAWHYKLAIIVLNVVKSSQKKKGAKVSILYEHLKRQNNIQNYVNKPISMGTSPIQEAHTFFKDFQKENGQSKEAACKILRQSNLSQELLKVENRKQTEVSLINITLQDLESERLSSDYEKEKNASLFQQIRNKRKIVKVVKDRVPFQTETLPAPKISKRFFQGDSEGNTDLERRAKKRKMDEFVVIPELQQSKREILQQKMMKKASHY